MKGSSDAEQVKNRRSFLRGTVATGAAIMGGAAFRRGKALAQDTADATVLTKGDIAILRFLAAAELDPVRPLATVCGTGWPHLGSTHKRWIRTSS